MMQVKKCCTCEKTKLLSEFNRNKSQEDGYAVCCRTCANAANATYTRNNPKKKRELGIKYRKENAGRITTYQQVYRVKNKERVVANHVVNYAIRIGTVVKPNICEGCGKAKTPIQGHHSSYSKERQLDVLWWCVSCHQQHHALLARAQKEFDSVAQHMELR